MGNLGKCSQCYKYARFVIQNVAAYTIVFPDKTEKTIFKDHGFCEDHGRDLWQQLKLASEGGIK